MFNALGHGELARNGVQPFLLQRFKNQRASELLIVVDDFEEVTRMLQKLGLTLHVACRLVDKVALCHPQMKQRLAPNAKIVNYTHLVSALVKLQRQ